MLSNELRNYIADHPSGKVKIAYADLDGILRGKYVSAEKFLSIAGSQTSFCNVIFGWDVNDTAYDNASYTGWHTGYPDAQTRIDLDTFRKIPWENEVPFFLGEMITPAGEPLHVCPRQLLKKVKQDALDEGFAAAFSQEFEWYNFAETPQSLEEKKFKDLAPITPGMFGYSILRASLKETYFSDLFSNLKKFRVPLEGLHTETGPGTYEAAIAHSEIIEAADRALLFKSGVKEIAYRHGYMATFMAKIQHDLPGCGGHIHQSLWESNGKRNIFFDKESDDGVSEPLKHYIAGQLHCLPHILPMYAPVINSYKRLVEGAWAPTTLTWGINNRTVAVRAIPGSNSSTRLEMRVPGADINPYLAMAAALASGLYGVKHKLPLKQQATTGNGYRDTSNGVLPSTLESATRKMKESGIANELFGESFVTHFVQTREWEWRQHLKAVTDWEYRRYFEII